jgi:hypothetical protein
MHGSLLVDFRWLMIMWQFVKSVVRFELSSTHLSREGRNEACHPGAPKPCSGDRSAENRV